jgi:hypothetical protein
MSRQYDRDNEAYDAHVRGESSRSGAGVIEGNGSVTMPGPGSRRGPSADDDRPNGRTMSLQLLYTNLSPRERSAADALLSLKDGDDR